MPTGVVVVLGPKTATRIKPPLQLGWTRQQKLLASGNLTYPTVGAGQTSGRCFLCRRPAKWSGLVQPPVQIVASRDLSFFVLGLTCDSDTDFNVRAWRCGVDCRQDRPQIGSNSGPVGRKDHDDGHLATGQVLLILEVLVSANENIEPNLLHCGDERAILELRPSAFVGGFDIVPGQELPKRARCALIEKDLHLRRRQGTLRCMLQHSANLLRRDALEPLDEVIDRGAAFQVFEQG